MQKVLIISYYFPPAGGSAVQRVTKFVKYLQQFHWQPVVLTAREKDFALRDESMKADIPGRISVYRTAAPDLYRVYGRLGKNEKKDHVELSALAVETGKGSGLKKLALWMRSAFFIPDARIAWLPFALIEGLRIIQKENIRVIFTTAPPFTTTLIGGLLSKITGIPWISDYRDPWTQAYFYYKRPWPVQRIEDGLEKWLLNGASRVLSINEILIRNLQTKYGLSLGEKWHVIPNGFDPEDFKQLKPVRNERFTIVYTGTVNTKMNPVSLFRAVRLWMQSESGLANQIRLVFIGRIGSDVAGLFRADDLKPMIRIIPHLSHRECLQHMAAADLLLLLIPQYPDNRLIMTNKLFEYMYSGQPILCLDETSLAADLIQKTRTGWAHSSSDVRGICQLLKGCYQRWKKGQALLQNPADLEAVHRYDRRRTTGELAALMDALNRIEKD